MQVELCHFHIDFSFVVLVRVPNILLTENSRTSPRLSRTHKTFFQDSVVAQQC